MTLAYFDLDDFKLLNDYYGHSTGDQVLLEIVQTIHRNTRSSDLLARLGGDEFALLLPEVNPDAALHLLVRMQQLIGEELAQKGWPVTLSVGAITFLCPREEPDQMIQLVDGMMYAAKRKGKGRVEHAVIERREPSEVEAWRQVERRATPRLVCDRAAWVHHAEGGALFGETPGDEEAVARVKDISLDGIRLHLDKQLAPNALLVVEPLAVETKTLLVRVLYATPDEEGWNHGCKLATRLSGEELAPGSVTETILKPASRLSQRNHRRLLAATLMFIHRGEASETVKFSSSTAVLVRPTPTTGLPGTLASRLTLRPSFSIARTAR